MLLGLSLIANLGNFEHYNHQIRGFIFENLIPTQQDMVVGYLDAFMENSLKLGLTGFIYILGTSVMFFKNYEYVVNRIFDAPPRPVWNSIATYWTMTTLTPILIAISIYLTGYIQLLLFEGSRISLLSLLPHVLVWLAFYMVFMISPNRPIHWKAGLAGSFATAFVWSISKGAYLYYMLHAKAYEGIYESFSAIMFFLLWIYFSWIVILYGMKFCATLDVEWAVCYNKPDQATKKENHPEG